MDVCLHLALGIGILTLHFVYTLLLKSRCFAFQTDDFVKNHLLGLFLSEWSQTLLYLLNKARDLIFFVIKLLNVVLIMLSTI